MKRLLSIILLLLPFSAMADDTGDLTISRRNAANTRYENYRVVIPGGDGVFTFSSGSAIPVWRTNAQFLADLSLEIGTDLQAWNAKLDTYAALADGTNGYQLTTNGAGGLSWAAAGSGTGAFSDAGDPVLLNTTTKDVVIGAAAINAAKLSVDGDADQVQLAIQGHSTQTTKLVEFENSSGVVTGSIDKDGNIIMGTSFAVTPVSLVDGFTGLYQGQIEYDDGTNSMIVDFGTAANQTVTMPPHTGTLATLAGTETLTNKSIAASQLTGIIADARMPDLTGDVTTIEGAVATTIANDAVTLAKMANIDGTAAQVILGRTTASAGDPELLATTGTRGSAVVLATSPTLVTPVLGVASATSLSAGTVFSDLFDAVGAVDMDYGSVDITDHTFVTDGTGTAEIVLPAGSIDGTEIMDSTVANADMADDAIDSAEIADGSVDRIHLAADAQKQFTEIITSSPVTLSIDAATGEGYGSIHYVAAGGGTVNLPAVVDGASFTIITIGAIAVSVDPNASDKIVLDGTTTPADGDKMTNLSTAGDLIVISYYSADGWHGSSNGWTDTN